MANVSSSNGIEKYPKLRFKGFSEPWIATRFGNIVDEYSDRTREEDEDILLSAAIEGMFLNSELFDHQRGASNKGYKKINMGTLVLSTQNLHLGNANVNLRFEHGMVSPAYKTYRIHDCSIELISEWVKSEKAKRFFYDATTVGASVCRRNVEWDTLYDQHLYLPSLTEQEHLASFLSTLSLRIKKQTELVERLKKYKRGVMHEIFETKTIFSDHHYTLVQLGNECRFFSGGTPQSGNPQFYGGTIPFIRSGEVHKTTTELTLTEDGLNNSSAKMVEVGDLIMALYGATSGEVDISKISGAINQAILCIRPNTINRHYLKFLFECKKEDILKTYLQGGQGNLSGEIIKKLCVEIPFPSEQQETVDYLVAFENKIGLEELKMEQLISIRRGLLQQLFI